MVKAQVELTDQQIHSVERMAAERCVSVADIIRESVDAYVRSASRLPKVEVRRRALVAIGAFSGPTDLPRRHDEYLGT